MGRVLGSFESFTFFQIGRRPWAFVGLVVLGGSATIPPRSSPATRRSASPGGGRAPQGPGCHSLGASTSARMTTVAGPLRSSPKSKTQMQRARRPWLLVFCNVTNKIRKRTDTAVAFTQEYSRVSYPLRNVSTLSTGSGSSKDTHVGVEKTEERTFCI